MTGQETAAMLALLSAAFWNGQPIPVEAAKIYRDHLKPLDVRDVAPAVHHIINTNTSGFYPAIGAIVERAHAFEEARLEQERSQREYPEPRSIEAKTGWLRGAPWFIHLQMARQRANLPAGYPLKEILEDDGRATLLDECRKMGVQVTEQEMSRWPR